MSWSILLQSTAMAAVRSPLPNFTTSTPMPRRMPLRLIVSTPNPRRRLTIRKNYLRQKLLKTLTKPYPNSLTLESPQTIPVITLELKQEQVLIEQFSGDYSPAAIGGELEELEKMHELREAEVQESVNLMDDRIGKVSKNSIFKNGLWLVGAFVFQTICAVWVLGSTEFEDKDGNMLSKDDKNGVLKLEVNGIGKSKVRFLSNTKMGLENGAVVFVDEDEMEKKIEEIQVMAREARVKERLEREKNGFESGDIDKEGEDEFGQSGIEKEVNDRLVKVVKRYEYTRRTLPVGSVDYVKKNGASEKKSLEGQESMDHVKKDGVSEKKSLGAKEGGEALMFKKKYRFRGLSSKPSDKPKGFTGLADHGVGKEVTSSKGGGSEVLMNGDIGGDVVDLLGNVRELDQAGDYRVGMSMRLEEDGGEKTSAGNTNIPKNYRKEVHEGKGWKKTGRESLAQEINQGKPLTKAVISRKSNILEKAVLSHEHDVLNKNGNLKNRGTQNNQSASEIGQKNSRSETDFWWLSLPYVLVILMQRKLFGNGLEQGLFTLKSTSSAKHDISHIVAFEDRGDATNFCYLVQSFFEDLEDFSAEIFPLSIEELKKRVKSHTLEVIVVKKGQLKLYAGQPLPDVEMALRSLVGQS